MPILAQEQQTKWRLLPQGDPGKTAALVGQLSVRYPFSPIVANIMVQRGLDTFEKAQSYFKPNLDDLHAPEKMCDMDLAVARILAAEKAGEKILVFGDYDVDGTTSVALVCLFLDAWGFSYDYYLPDRYREGYGLSYEGIDHAKAIGASLMVALDCGIKAHDKARFARSKGIDLIICDHHTPAATLPEAVAVLDPKRSDCEYPFKELTGCGIGLKLCQAVQHALLKEGRQLPSPGYEPLTAYADLLALSIACDIVPLVGENRLIVHIGLEKLCNNPLPGIKSIMNLSERERDWNVSDLVFFIGPHINAAGRLGHARDAVKVLLGEIDGLASDLADSNTSRKGLDKQMTEQALEIIQQDPAYPHRYTTVLYQSEWHKGVIGIVASRLIERHYRPTVMLTRSEDKLVGSARSVKGFDLYQALEQCTPHLLQFGGHKYAAGLTLKEEELLSFTEAFEAAVARQILPEQRVPVLDIDQKIPFSAIDNRLIRLLQRMGPFGPHNMTPVFMTPNVEVIDAVILKEDHVRLTLKQDGFVFSGIGFNLAEKWQALNCLWLDVAFQPSFNTWKERTFIDLKLKDFRKPHD